jgi:hypothetical protein
MHRNMLRITECAVTHVTSFKLENTGCICNSSKRYYYICYDRCLFMAKGHDSYCGFARRPHVEQSQ